jgi:hypothetical protein
MSNTGRLFASFAFAFVAVFLVIYTWLPSRDSLQLGLELCKILILFLDGHSRNQFFPRARARARNAC